MAFTVEDKTVHLTYWRHCVLARLTENR